MKSLWNTSQIEMLKKEYPSKGAKALESLIPFNEKQIRKKANKLGLKVSKLRKSQAQKENATRERPELCKINSTIATNLYNPISNYILGFLWADGYLINSKNNPYSIRLEILTSDFIEIEKHLSKLGNWTITHRKRPNRKPITRISTSNKAFYTFLIENGYKTQHPSIIEHIPNELKRFWMIGLFDGDGCIYRNKKNHCTQLSISGTYNQNWKPILNYLNKIGCICKPTQRIHNLKSKSSAIRCTNIKEIREFALETYLHNSTNVGLTRKKQKFEQINDDLLKSQIDHSL